MKLESWGGAILEWPQDTSDDQGLTVWNLAEKDSSWFSPSESSFMINYRIDDMDEMLEQLRAGGVEIQKGPESHENGKFAWIMDPEGNKVELWQPMAWTRRTRKPDLQSDDLLPRLASATDFWSLSNSCNQRRRRRLRESRRLLTKGMERRRLRRHRGWAFRREEARRIIVEEIRVAEREAR